jgi:hypothetical protein
LAVISSDARAGDRYAGSLADLASALREQDDETATEDETN